MSELRALGNVAGQAFSDGVEVIAGVHRAVARRAPSAPGQRAIASAVYGAVQGAGRATASAAGAALEAAGLREPSRNPRAALAVGALNGLLGDRLEEEHSPLAFEMAFHPAAPADPTGKLVVFVHGLGETESAWKLGGHPPYG
jgi:hypothetical protein